MPCATMNTGNGWQWYFDLRKRVAEKGLIALYELGFSVRVDNCLRHAQVSTLSELLAKKPGDLLELPKFGRKCLLEVEVLLADLGTRLAGSDAEYPTDPLPNRFEYSLEEAYARIEMSRSRAEMISLQSYISALERYQKMASALQCEQASHDVAKATAAGNPHLEKIAASGGFTQRELTVLRERGASKTLRQIRDILGLKGVEMVRQAEARAYRKLRHPSKKHLAPEVHGLGLCERVGIICDVCEPGEAGRNNA